MMGNKKTYAGLGVMMVSVALLAAACGGGGGGGGTSGSGTPGGGATGATLSFSMTTGSFSLTNLVYSAALSSSAPFGPGTTWHQFNFYNGTADAAVDYFTNSTQDTLDLQASPDGGTTWYYAGPPATSLSTCWVSGVSNTSSLPLCTSWGIAVSRTAGTIAFTNTPVYAKASSAVTGTTSGGPLTFPPF